MFFSRLLPTSFKTPCGNSSGGIVCMLELDCLWPSALASQPLTLLWMLSSCLDSLCFGVLSFFVYGDFPKDLTNGNRSKGAPCVGTPSYWLGLVKVSVESWYPFALHPVLAIHPDVHMIVLLSQSIYLRASLGLLLRLGRPVTSLCPYRDTYMQPAVSYQRV